MSASTSAHDVHAAAETRTRAAADKAQSAGHKVAGHPVVQSSINSVQRQMNILGPCLPSPCSCATLSVCC
jgi:hypothetical protein